MCRGFKHEKQSLELTLYKEKLLYLKRGHYVGHEIASAVDAPVLEF